MLTKDSLVEANDEKEKYNKCQIASKILHLSSKILGSISRQMVLIID